MNKYFENTLFKKYPKLLCKIRKIECGDGWYWLIDNLFSEIHYINNINPKVTQIKEKLGVLRVYLEDAVEEEIDCLVSFTQLLSSITCENCGQMGAELVYLDDIYMQTLCERCKEEIN